LKKVLFIFGTRPEAIKLAPLILEFRKENYFEVIVCTTAQHRQMLDQVLQVFAIKPDLDLNLMKHNQGLSQLTASTVTETDKILNSVNPDLVIVQGDTTTVLASSLACFYNKIKVAHVEAGLRTYNKLSPFPEELNRTLTGVIAEWHFAPTASAKANLLKENIAEDAITVTGNTVIDALLIAKERLKMPENFSLVDSEVQRIVAAKRKYVLITSHRRENFGDGIRSICNAIVNLAGSFPDIDFIYPVHLNPNIQKPVFELLSDRPNIKLLSPLDYPSFVVLMDNSYIILTDSGGVQEEAPALGKPVLVMRDTTERPEAVEAGVAKLVGFDDQKIVDATKQLLSDSNKYLEMALNISPYGDGKASKRICEFVKGRL
jgi:UDP-N-acetylglucosamine 2-epimerase (non-hydrolysing)